MKPVLRGVRRAERPRAERVAGGAGSRKRKSGTGGSALRRAAPHRPVVPTLEPLDRFPRHRRDGEGHRAGLEVGVHDEIEVARPVHNGRDVQYPVALALARIGDSSRARELTADLQHRFPEDTSVRFGYLPVLRAQLALNERNPSLALRALEPAARFDLAAHGVAFNGFFGAMYTVFLRGEAYLAAGQPAEALREFERIIAHRGIVLADPVDAFARLQRARALVALGHTADARRAYEDIMQLWRDADAQLPLLERVKAEYAALR